MPQEKETSAIPSWLTQRQDYQPASDHDAFITKSVLSVSSVLARLRLDDGASTPFSPSAPVKLLLALACILLVSLSRNYLFVMVMLACVLLRAALLPQSALVRVVGSSVAAALLTLVVMLPAVFLGQPRSALTMAGKTLTCTGIAMELALTTPPAELTGALRSFHVPNLVIMTLDLTLKSIVCLGKVALEVLTALQLRSVGRNRNKSSAMGGVGGVVLLKAVEASQQTHDAMRCRGFEGNYDTHRAQRLQPIDLAWLAMLLAIVCLFVHLQGVM